MWTKIEFQVNIDEAQLTQDRMAEIQYGFLKMLHSMGFRTQGETDVLYGDGFYVGPIEAT